MSWPKKHIWEYRTSPEHPFDYTLWFLLRPLMLARAHGKISHWWHWRKVKKDPELKGTLIKADPQAFPRNNAFDKIRMSLGGWKTVYVVEPKEDYDEWFYAFCETDRNFMERCSIILEGPVRILTGPDDFLVFALDKDGNELPLKIHLQALRSDKTHRHHPIV